MKDTAPSTALETPPINAHPPSIHFNWMDWLPFFDHLDAPMEQKRAWIEAVWSIVAAFVDLGFEIKSDTEICGEDVDLTALLSSGMLRSSDTNMDGTEVSDDE